MSSSLRSSRTLRRLIRDESGAANTEYVIVGGLVIIAIIAVIGMLGPKVLAKWTILGERVGGADPMITTSVRQSLPPSAS